METAPNVRKRPKQACKNCRRKKARCPGERPSCSFCTRLKQHCEYDEPTAPRKVKSMGSQAKTARLAERVAELESKLQSLSDSKEDESNAPAYCPTGFLQSPAFESNPQNHGSRQHSLTSTEESFAVDLGLPKFQRIPPKHSVVAAVDAFFLVCHSRPCTLFFRDKFQQELDNDMIPIFLIRAIVASTAHLLLDPWFEGNQLEASQTMARLAWTEVMTDAMCETPTNIVTIIQTMALLILFDNRTSSYASAVTKLRMAVSIAQSAGMNKEPDEQLPVLQQEERRYVFWSLYIIDKTSALMLGNAPLLADRSCFVRLPEEPRVFWKSQQNNMDDLSSVKQSSSTRGGFARLIVTSSLLGQLAAISQDDTLYRGRFGGSVLELHKSLATQIRQLGLILSEDEGSSLATIGTEGRVQMLYARSMFHVVGIFVNHPFFVKRYIPAHQRSPQVCMRTNQQCREHAERLGDWLSLAKSYDAVPHNQLFPGYAIFNAGLVHCLFMRSPDQSVAAKSREQYAKLKVLLHQQTASGMSSDPNYYIQTLDYFANKPGAARFLADASNSYIPTSGSPGLWHFLDFSWLDDLFSYREDSNTQARDDNSNLTSEYTASSTNLASFPCFNTASSDTPTPKPEQQISSTRHPPLRPSPETTFQTWSTNNNDKTKPNAPDQDFQQYGYVMPDSAMQNGTGIPTPSQSPLFSMNNDPQLYGMMESEPESFGSWLANAYSRWDATSANSGDIGLLYG